MTYLLDASVALRWFVDQPGSEAAAHWLKRFASEPKLLIAPDILRFELFGGLSRLQPRQGKGWAARCFMRFDRLGVRTLASTKTLFERALELAYDIRMGGYDALYLAHAESLGIPWLTADAKVLRRLKGDARLHPLEMPPEPS